MPGIRPEGSTPTCPCRPARWKVTVTFRCSPRASCTVAAMTYAALKRKDRRTIARLRKAIKADEASIRALS